MTDTLKLHLKLDSVNRGYNSVFNVRDFGAVGDGIVDDTKAIQDAIDASIDQRYTPTETTRICLGAVYLPTGMYKITEPLKIYSVLGFRMYGDGASSVIHPMGKLDFALDINGAAWSEWDHFRIDGAGVGELIDVVSLEWNPLVAGRSTSQCRFVFIDIMNFKSFVNGFNIGKNSENRQVDCSYFEHCSVGGSWVAGDIVNFQNAFLIGSSSHGNNVCHFLTHPILAGCRYLITSKGTLPVTVMGGSFGDAESVFLWQTSGPLTCIGGRAESCQRLYIDNTVAGWDATVIIQNFVFMAGKLHTDGIIVSWNTGGRLKLDGLTIGSARPGNPPTITVQAWAAASINLDGVNAKTDPRNFVRITSGVSENVYITCNGYRQILDTGASVFTEDSNFIRGGVKITGKVTVDGDIKVNSINTSAVNTTTINTNSIGANVISANCVKTNSVNLSDTQKWDQTGLFIDADRYWTKDGLYPGPSMLIKCKGVGTILARANGNLDWLGWYGGGTTIGKLV